MPVPAMRLKGMKLARSVFTLQASLREVPMKFAALAVPFFAFFLGSCAAPGSLTAGQSTEADVRARMGTPTDTRSDRGDKLLEYATGPEGFRTRLVRIGADGRVKEVTELLTEEQFAKIIPGQTSRAEVRNLLGRPAFETNYRSGPGLSWRHLRGGVQPGYMIVSFNPNDTVREKIIIYDQPGDSRDD
jgi:hypothetical protein